eukprot:7341496-Heterocapsa_arctica.AAC.1
MVCFAMRDKGTCDLEEECPYSHDPQKINASKAAIAAGTAKKEVDKGKGKGKGKSKSLCWDFQVGKCTR